MPQYRAASRHSWHWRFASLDRGGPTRSRSSPCSDPPQGQRRCCFTLTYSGIILKRLSGAHFFEDPASRLCLRFRRVPESHSASIWDSSSSHGVSPNISRIPTRVKSEFRGFSKRRGTPEPHLIYWLLRRSRNTVPGGSLDEARPLILLRKWSKLIGPHRPQTRARENRRAGSIEQAPCTVAHIADPTEELCCQSRKNTLPIWDARFCRARVASHRSGSGTRARCVRRLSARCPAA